MKKIILSLTLMLFATGICSAQTALYFPQFVDGVPPGSGVRWISAIVVTNTAALGTPAASAGVAPASVTVTFQRADGSGTDPVTVDCT